jgi:RNA methyltransferase, TrmH family
MDKFKKYKNDYSYSYALGVYPTLELINHQRSTIQKIIISPKGIVNKGVKEIVQICRDADIPIDVNKKFIETVATTENTYAIGIFNKYTTHLEALKNHMLLVNPSDMGNLGTICRTMLGFNINNLAIIKPAADLFDPKVIRASMGAIFSINFEYFDNIKSYVQKYIRNYYTFMTNGKNTLGALQFVQPYSLIFGNEGAGLSTEYQDLGKSVKIKQSEGIDSLNLAVSAGIALYEANKQLL